jgi:hypothetical protein
MEKPKGIPGFDTFIHRTTPIVREIFSKYTPEQKKEIYDCLVKHNETAEKAFLERLAERKKRKSLD